MPFRAREGGTGSVQEVKDMKKAGLNKIKKSLLTQLEKRGAKIEVFRAQVDDYVAMVSVCEMLKADIEKNGAVMSESGKPNPSIKELRDTNKAMQGILARMCISGDTVVPEEDDKL